MNAKALAYKIISDRKEQAEETARKNSEELLKDAEYYALNSECKKLVFEIARLGSQNKDTGDLNKKYSELSERRALRMKELGKTPDDIVPKYFCPVCHDTGVTSEGDCACLKELVYRIVREDASVPGNGMSIPEAAAREEAADNPELSSLYKLLLRYVASFPEVRKIYLLSGPVGVGKSFAAGVVAGELMRQGHTTLFLGANKLNDRFLRYHLAHLSAKRELFAPLLEAELLVIDDLGSETLLNNVTVNYLYNLLTEREFPTIITTNLGEKELRNRYTDRIFSRLMDAENAKVLKLNGRDMRLKKGSSRGEKK